MKVNIFGKFFFFLNITIWKEEHYWLLTLRVYNCYLRPNIREYERVMYLLCLAIPYKIKFWKCSLSHGYSWLLVSSYFREKNKQTNKNKNENSSILLLQLLLSRLSQFHKYARPITKQTLNWHSVAPSLSYFVDS